MFCTFSLENVLLATAACNFSTSQLQKAVRSWHVLHIFTWKCASRHSGVQFFISPLTTWLRTRRFNEPTFRLTRRTNHWKNTAFRDFSNIWRGCIFFLLTLLHLICFSSAFQLSILSEVHYLNFLRLRFTSFHSGKYRNVMRFSMILPRPGADLGQPHGPRWSKWSQRSGAQTARPDEPSCASHAA